MGILDQIAETRAERRSRLQQEETETTKTTDGSPAGGVSNQKNGAGWRFIGCMALLFGGLILTVAGIGWMGLSSEATYQLTHVALRLGFVVTLLSLFFGRRWINLKTTLIATAILSVGIVLFVFWTVSQSSVRAISHEESKPPLIPLTPLNQQQQADADGFTPLKPVQPTETPLISMIQAETFALAADVTDHPNPYIGAQVKISGHLAHGNVQDQDQEWYNIEIHCFKKEGECEVTRTYLSCRAAFGDVIKLYSFYDPYRLRSWSDTKIVADLGGNIVIIQLGDLIGPNKFTHSMTYKAKAFLDGEEVLGGDWFIQQRR